MEIAFNIKKEKIDISKNIYECSNCGKLFNWGKNSSWFGSYHNLENNPELITYSCSDKCQKNKPETT